VVVMMFSETVQEQVREISRCNHPKNISWTWWSVRFLRRRARRGDAEWSFHSKELQHRHAP